MCINKLIMNGWKDDGNHFFQKAADLKHIQK